MLSVEEVSTNCRSRGDGPTRLPPPLASPPPPPPPPPAPPPRPVVRTTMDAQPDWQHGQTMDLLTRTSWVDASVAYRQIRKGKASGSTCAMWVRATIQTHIFNLGCFTQKHCGKVLFLGLLLLSLCCVGLKTATLETDMEKLWVQDGGRLSTELAYTTRVLGEGSGTTLELMLQTGAELHDDVLSPQSLLQHYDALHRATKVTVNLFDMTWSFADICYTASFPRFDNPMFDHILEKIVPCLIITPLDCFWEGSKLLGPKLGLYVPGYSPPSVKWSNLHPVELVESLAKLPRSYFPADAILNVLKRAGISSGYLEKPCLNPMDVLCPASAPNKHSKQLPHIASVLTGGCTGFATKYMKWPEDLIIGAAQKNKTGHVTKAEALQSIVQLVGDKALFELYQDTNRVRSISWSRDKAARILQAWQRKFTETVRALKTKTGADKVYSFSSTSLLDILAEFSQVSVLRVTMGYVLMLLYACLCLLRWRDAVQSQSGIALAGVLLVALSVAAGLGLCSVIGIPFNASTTQILPFLSLGIGVDDMFFIAHTFGESNQDSPHAEQVGRCMRQAGVNVLLTSLSNAIAFFIAAIIPIPALRSFVLQAAILVIVNLASIIIVFPAFISYDLMRRNSNRIDVFCCFTGSNLEKVVELNQVNAAGRGSSQYHQSRRGGSRERTHDWSGSSHYDQSRGGGGRDAARYDQSRVTVQPSHYDRVRHGASRHDDVVIEMSPYEQRYDPAGSLGATAQQAGRSLSPPPSYATLTPRDAVSRTEADGSRPVTHLLPTRAALRSNVVAPAPLTTSWCPVVSQRHHKTCSITNFSLSSFAKHIYAPLLQKTPVKVFIVVVFVLFLLLSIVGSLRVREGLAATDVVPRDSHEYAFLEAQQRYFSFYNFYAVTQDKFDYPNEQELLHQYHRSFQHISNIMKKEDGSLPDFWLKLFRDWMRYMQAAFDEAVSSGCIGSDVGWYSNATDDAILAYKLIIQTGDVDDPIDRNRVYTVRLVSDDGIIAPDAFYNYLSAWTSNDALGYAASQADLHPYPRQWFHDAVDRELKIPKSQPLVYTQLPFYLHDMADTQQVITTIKEVRLICDELTALGLPNYPRGVPFTFWEQYLHLRLYLLLALAAVLIAVFLVLSLALFNPWAAIIVVSVLAMMVVDLFGLMGWLGIKLSAVPAVILVVSVGIGVEFTVHVTMGYLTAIGSRAHRTSVSLEHTFAPVTHGAVSSLLGIVMLAGAQFDFIVKYFFVVLSLLILLGVLHGLVLLPVLLSVIGPPAEVTPADHGDMLAPPTPEPSPPPPRRRTRRHQSDISLTTITEEPTQCSHEVIIQPNVHVEMMSPTGAGAATYNAHCPSAHCHHVTTVSATTRVKVHINTVLPGAVEHSYKSRRRKDEGDYNSDSESST